MVPGPAYRCKESVAVSLPCRCNTNTDSVVVQGRVHTLQLCRHRYRQTHWRKLDSVQRSRANTFFDFCSSLASRGFDQRRPLPSCCFRRRCRRSPWFHRHACFVRVDSCSNKHFISNTRDSETSILSGRRFWFDTLFLRRDVVILWRRFFALYLVFMVGVGGYERNVYCVVTFHGLVVRMVNKRGSSCSFSR
jgi:hypothetical protein